MTRDPKTPLTEFTAFTEKQLADRAALPAGRATSPALETHFGHSWAALDHGFVRLVDYMGNEASIVRAARVSYGQGTKTVSDDRALLRYLMRNRHTSPLEMCEITLHCKLPIFVARQWIRHRTANVNELSARYSELPEEFYVPDLDRMQVQSATNKQGSSGVLEPTAAKAVADTMRGSAVEAFTEYAAFMSAHDLSRELARVVLPLGTYTEWYWKTDLHNLLHFLSLRLDEHAQHEIRVYADIIWCMVQDWVPNIAEAFTDYRLDAVTLSGREVAVLREILREAEAGGDKNLAGIDHLLKIGGSSSREIAAFRKAFGLGEPK